MPWLLYPNFPPNLLGKPLVTYRPGYFSQVSLMISLKTLHRQLRNTRAEEAKNLQQANLNQPPGKWACKAQVIYVSRENREQRGKEGIEKNVYDPKRAGEGKGEQENSGRIQSNGSKVTGPWPESAPCPLSHVPPYVTIHHISRFTSVLHLGKHGIFITLKLSIWSRCQGIPARTLCPTPRTISPGVP